LGYLHGIFSIGSLLAPIIAYGLLRHTDWRGVHYAVAAASILSALLISLLARGSGISGAVTALREKTLDIADLAEYMKSKRNLILALTGLLAALAQTGLLAWIVRYMAVRFDAAELGALSISAYWLCATINRFCLSQVIRRAPMKFFAIGAVLYAALLVAGVLSESPVIMTVMVGASGLVSGQFVPGLVSQCAVGYEGKTTLTTSFIMIVMGIGRIVAPLMMAFASTQVSFAFGMMIPAATAIAAAASGWLVVLRSKEQS
jgi:predicted MFS family arabinose efflux permease